MGSISEHRPEVKQAVGFVPSIFVPGNCRGSIHGVTCYRKVLSPSPIFLGVELADGHVLRDQKITIDKGVPRCKIRGYHQHFHYVIGVILLLTATVLFPPPCSASDTISHIQSLSELKDSLVLVLDKMSRSGSKGMIVYASSFLLWTMTVGITTPIETAAGMAFPLSKSIPLSATGKIGGAFAQYLLAKYVIFGWARRKMEKNEWMHKIDSSFQSHPFGVALIWRFSPLPEFVKNVGPALVPTLKTRYQILAVLVHGLPFTVLWSCLGNEAGLVARGGQASLVWKRIVAVISWVGFVVSPTLFGWWIKGLGELKEGDEISPRNI